MAAQAGDASVTLTWNDFDLDYTVSSYEYRQNSGDGWGAWTTTTDFTRDESTDPYTFTLAISELTNGTTYSFQVRAKNLTGEGADGSAVHATPQGPPAAPDLRATPGDREVRLFWTDLDDDTITKFQYRKGITPENPEAAVLWDPDWDDITGSSATTVNHTVTGLTNGTEYTFEVRAINDEGDGDSASIDATPSTAEIAPSAMSNVQHVVTGFTGGSSGQVKFTWDNPENDQIDKYQYRFDASASDPDEWDQDWINIPGTNNKDMTSSDPTSIPGTSVTLFYQLRAVNNDADDADTDDVNEGAGPATAITVTRSNTPGTSTDPPGAPGDLTATPGVGQVTLSWTAPTPPAGTAITKYQYRQNPDSDGNAVWTDWADITTSTTDTTISGSVTGLSDGTTYTFEVRAFHNNATSSDPSDDVAGAAARAETVTPGAPNAPATLAASADADQQITLTWTAGLDITNVIVTGFEYRQRASGDAKWGGWNEITGSGATTTTYSVTSLEIGTAYEFQVRAVSASGESQPSPTASATTISPPMPLKPTGLTVTAGDDSVTLRWKSPEDLAIDKYRYRKTSTVTSGEPDFLSSSSPSPWTPIMDSGSGTIEHKVPDLTVGTLYYFQIQSGSAYGYSEASDTVSARPVPVRGEWSFDAVIYPNTLASGSTTGAEITFRAIYTVTSGDPTVLDFSITGSSSETLQFDNTPPNNDKIGHGSDLGDLSNTVLGTTLANFDGSFPCVSDLRASPQTITCTWATLGGGRKLLAKADATPGVYLVTVNLNQDTTFRASASTGGENGVEGFLSASSTIGKGDLFSLGLEVIPGVPDAPAGLTATPGNSRVTLAWDDPENPNITGYKYQQTETAPGITLRWTGSSDSGVTKYQYRHTTTEPDIQLSWSYPGGFVLGDAVVYEYRRTTTEPGVTLSWTDPGIAGITRYEYRSTTATTGEGDPDFSEVTTWIQIPDSGPTTTSFKVTGLDLGETHYFEVRPFTDSAGDALTTLTTTVEYFDGADWVPIPHSGPATLTYRITGLDFNETHYFEVRPVKDGAQRSNVHPLTDTVHNFEGAIWTDIPDRDVGEVNRSSYKVTATEISGLDLRVTNYFEVRPVRAGSPAGAAIAATATANVTLSWETSGPPIDVAKYQYRHTTTITTGR